MRDKSDTIDALEDNGFKGSNKRKFDKKKLLIVVSGAALLLFILFSGDNTKEKTKSLTDNDEHFDTSVFSPPSYLKDVEKPEEPKKENILEIPEPQETTTTFEVPPPPEPFKVVEEEDIPARFKSNMIVIDSATKSAEQSTIDSANITVTGNDKNSAFLARAVSRGETTAQAKQLHRIDALIPEGTLIPGILETAVNSDLPGQLRAVVSDDVYSLDGRRVLIPTGTKLIGEYQSEVMTGQTRIFVVWSRLIRDDGVSIRLNSIGADSLGRSGITGHVDRKFREKFTSSILLSVVGAGSSYAMGYGNNNNSYSNDRSASDLARETIAETFSNMANTVLNENLRIPPTISVSQGERIFVYVRQDLDFSDFYKDPVTEALIQIKKERNLK